MAKNTEDKKVTEAANHRHGLQAAHERRQDWVATYAYFLAEARGFIPEHEMEDWLKAERAYVEQGLAKGESD